MNTALKFLLLLIHLLIAGIIVYYIGDYVSHADNFIVLVLGGIVYSAIMITIIFHTTNFIIHFKNTIKKP